MEIVSAETWIDELTDFLLSRPTPEQIIAYEVSDSLDNRLQYLMGQNRNEALTPAERNELNRFLEFDHIFTILKAKARHRLEKKE